MEYSTVDGNPTRRGRSSRPRGSGSSVAPVGRHTTRATSMRCAAIGSMRGACWRCTSPTKWRPARYVLDTPPVMTEKVGFFASCLCRSKSAGLVLGFLCIKKTSAQFHLVARLEFLFAFGPPKAPWCDVWGLVDLGGLLGANITPRTCYVCKDVYECSLFYRMQNDNRHGNAPLERAGEREAGLSPGQEPVCAGHAAEGWPNCIAAPMTSFIVFSNNCSSRYLVLFNFHLFHCFIPFCSIKTYVQNLHRYSCCVLALCPALCDRLNNTHRHHGALYDYVFKRPTFLVFTSRSPELSPIDICSDTRKSTRF